MKSYPSVIRDEIYRDHAFAIDLIEIHLKTQSGSNNPLYLATGAIDIDYDSTTAPTAGTNTYSAQGDFLGMTAINEDFDVKVGKFSIFLSGLGTNYISRFVDGEPEGKRVVVYKAFMSLETFEIINAPILMFDGAIFNIAITEGQNSCQINVDCSSLFADFERTAGRRTNNWSNWLYQGTQYDTSMDKAGYVGQTEFLWGRLAK